MAIAKERAEKFTGLRYIPTRTRGAAVCAKLSHDRHHPVAGLKRVNFLSLRFDRSLGLIRLEDVLHLAGHFVQPLSGLEAELRQSATAAGFGSTPLASSA